MSGALATALRVVWQLRHDPRSVVMLLLLPTILLLLFRYVFDHQPEVFARVGPQMLALFPFILMFLITSVTMVRERTSGTLERLLTTPLPRGGLIGGYALAFSLVALVQSAISLAVGQWALDLGLDRPWEGLVFAILGSVVGTALGLLASAFARTEFQAVQFMPLAIIPQILVCGLLVPVDQMPDVLRWLSVVMPLTYATDAFTSLAAGETSGERVTDLLVLIAFAIGSVALASLTLRRRTP
ncbi:ABC transporter permease subunit [Aeromicrobium sp. 636]|uniref:Transport permease protein n=1 Tax=Aeromicrobium senzhongii TaxID=2663859 RepID=A0A8I0EX57_9ACTN|nr:MULTISPECIES: ABC transporter permease [Aeromicrobium]MBC9227194.1 ABC transporter permease [Aeromicrobium senzhongii]MCQ3999293.1 ABC transporter permease subunit [Aeromicrobium sp. 636]MTB88395.1 ABC transporter permease subunit [Aeromicrobium senzhongii]QNL94636.1 ABC transporter permease [Aeromicrobium senzhongii]